MENKNKIIIILVFIILSLLICLKFKNNKNNSNLYSNKSFKITQENKTIQKNNYNINISYPKTNDKNLNKIIDTIIEIPKNNFIKNNKNNNQESELNINYYQYKKDNIICFHFIIYENDIDEKRVDTSLIYNIKTKKRLTIDKLIKKDEQNNIAITIKQHLKDYPKVNINTILQNLQFLYFDEKEITVVYPPQVLDNLNENEVIINLKYNEFKETFYLDTQKEYELAEAERIEEERLAAEKALPQKRDLTKYLDKKVIAITFDDGPSSKCTPILLEELKKRDARVSFFMVGNMAKNNQDIVKKAYEDGHTIGSHTYSHKNLKKLKKDDVINEIESANNIISEIIQKPLDFLRPPYGNYNSKILSYVDMTFILWNVDTEDWKHKDAEYVSNYIVNNAKDGDIILLHDLYETSINGAIQAIDQLIPQNFAFVSLEELAEIKSITLEKHTAYRFIK